MSYGEELLTELEISHCLYEIELEKIYIKNMAFIESGLWTTSDNKVLHIKKMGTPHIRNCIALLERNLPHYVPMKQEFALAYIEKFKNELKRRNLNLSVIDPAEGFYEEE